MNNIAKIEARAERIGARGALAISTETFSESFSRLVRNCSSKQCQSTLNLFVESRNFEPKNGREPPDSDSRLHHYALTHLTRLNSPIARLTNQ
jgi:hypothetical protein